jgi:hypothetical protein
LFHRGALLDIELVKQIRHAGLWGRMFPSRAMIRVGPEDSLYTMRGAANKLWAGARRFAVIILSSTASRPAHLSACPKQIMGETDCTIYNP